MKVGSSPSCHSRHCSRNQMIQVPIGWSGQFECSVADVVQSFIIDTEAFIGIFNELMHTQRCIVWLDNRVRDLRRWDD